LHFGRFAIDSFLFSDTINVGHASVSFLEGAPGTTAADLQIGGVTLTPSAKYANVDAPLSLPIRPHGLTYETRDNFIANDAQYDDGRAIVLTEWTKRTQNDIPIVNMPLAASAQWYVAGGWHFGKATPMVTFGEYLLNIQLMSPPGSFNNWSGALRYDVVRSVALRLTPT
jgi:hypothetical protein